MIARKLPSFVLLNPPNIILRRNPRIVIPLSNSMHRSLNCAGRARDKDARPVIVGGRRGSGRGSGVLGGGIRVWERIKREQLRLMAFTRAQKRGEVGIVEV